MERACQYCGQMPCERTTVGCALEHARRQAKHQDKLLARMLRESLRQPIRKGFDNANLDATIR